MNTVTASKNEAASLLSRAQTSCLKLFHTFFSYSAWLVTAYEQLVGALAGAVVGSVEGLAKALQRRTPAPLPPPLTPPPAQDVELLVSARPPVPARKAAPATKANKPVPVMAEPLPPMATTSQAPAVVPPTLSFAKAAAEPVEAQQAPSTPEPSVPATPRKPAKSSNRRPAIPPTLAIPVHMHLPVVPVTAAPPLMAHPAPAVSRLESFPVMMSSRPSSAASTKTSEDDKDGAAELPKVQATALKGSLPGPTGTDAATEPTPGTADAASSSSGPALSQKKKRGPIRGPMHKAGKEMKTLFNLG